jgi:hypothetical protein
MDTRHTRFQEAKTFAIGKGVSLAGRGYPELPCFVDDNTLERVKSK